MISSLSIRTAGRRAANPHTAPVQASHIRGWMADVGQQCKVALARMAMPNSRRRQDEIDANLSAGVAGLDIGAD